MMDIIVAACSRLSDANRAFETFEMYEKLGLKHRTESYNSLMEICAKQRQVEVIMKLLGEMTNEDVKPNVDTYMQILEGYISSGDTIGITNALTITRSEGFTPTLRVLDRAMACAEKHNDDKCRQLVRKELMAAGHRFGIQANPFQRRGPGGGGRRGGGRGGGPGRGSGAEGEGVGTARGGEGSPSTSEPGVTHLASAAASGAGDQMVRFGSRGGYRGNRGGRRGGGRGGGARQSQYGYPGSNTAGAGNPVTELGKPAPAADVGMELSGVQTESAVQSPSQQPDAATQAAAPT
eukprot:evm.model.scf_989.8 EVM.evm.TU.scf_989.8   scf_989:50557-52887(+)